MVFGIGPCNSGHPVGEFPWHWTRKSRVACNAEAARRRATHAEALAEPPSVRLMADAVARHDPVPPSSDIEIAVLRNGERQLTRDDADLYRLLELLLRPKIYDINTAARQGLIVEGPPTTMDEIPRSLQKEVQGMFTAFGADLNLDEPMKVYRGLGLPPLNEDDPFDFWSLWAFLRGKATLSGQLLTDPGVAFASFDEDIARRFPLQRHRRGPEVAARVMLQLTVCRGLCLPAPEHRSKDLFERLYWSDILRRATGQVVIPPDTTWRVTSAEPADPTGWARIALEQVLT